MNIDVSVILTIAGPARPKRVQSPGNVRPISAA
jgi:hypothetical protein